MKRVMASLAAVSAAAFLAAGAFAESARPDGHGVLVGFNTKSNLETAAQTRMVRAEFASRKAAGFPTDRLRLRIQGGTSSQVHMPSDYNDSMLKAWVEFQREFGCRFIFVVNFNDTPESQAQSFQRWLDFGASYETVELGNEQYLPKFRLSKTQMREVTKRTSGMTVEKYLQMCREYVDAFRGFGLPFFVQLAPEKDRLASEQWNMPVAKALNSGFFGDARVDCAIHLYEKGEPGSLDASQIRRVRALFTKPVRIAVTESGVTAEKYMMESLQLKPELYAEFVERERGVAKRLLAELEDGDMLLNQVLFNDYKKTHEPCFHPAFKGVTGKGRMLLDLFAGHLEKKTPGEKSGD